jgi:hypothetical protein
VEAVLRHGVGLALAEPAKKPKRKRAARP